MSLFVFNFKFYSGKIYPCPHEIELRCIQYKIGSIEDDLLAMEFDDLDLHFPMTTWILLSFKKLT